jgi:glutathione S-transferase
MLRLHASGELDPETSSGRRRRTREKRMLKLIIGNKAYSSWSLRGWLAGQAIGAPVRRNHRPMFDEDWDKRRAGDEFAPSGGKVPVLWDDKAVIWDSLAIVEWLADKTDRARYWPNDDSAREWRARWPPRCTRATRICAANAR